MTGRLQKNRIQYERLGLVLARYIRRIPLTANQVTVLSLLFSVGAGFAIGMKSLPWALIGIAFMGLADVLDGSLARAQGKASQFGGVLDHTMDRYAEMVLLLGVMASGLVDPGWVLFSLFGMVMASYVRAKAESKPGLDSCNVGFAGRLEKLLILLVGLVLELTGLLVSALGWAVILIGIISHITVLQRLLYSWHRLADLPE